MSRLSRSMSLACRQAGATMIEVLVTIFILAFGLLGLAGMLMQIQTAELESYQRVQAIVLANDMAERILANRTNDATATNFSTAEVLGTGGDTDCSGLTGYDLDKCEWGLSLQGSAETSGASSVGAMIGARGCISQVQSADATSGTCLPAIYRVDVVWQGQAETVAPSVTCGQNLYGNDANRRAVSRNITIGLPSCT